MQVSLTPAGMISWLAITSTFTGDLIISSCGLQ